MHIILKIILVAAKQIRLIESLSIALPSKYLKVIKLLLCHVLIYPKNIRTVTLGGELFLLSNVKQSIII